ncbi:Fic family protein [Muricauda sp. SCSIO 64092]|uniref:Fic family protein n=1 Tax=Allomuricauda sp. SCSIO 64092 TaxID=2908842 RepID=UPI001FF60D7B|nr:Fic family protein [Muricauda sp. SCSIO 64092]UOY04807.1 Fic family protein [Muricauda sp. SCSIO 64092]
MIIKAPVFDFETDFVFPESIELAEFDDPTFKKVEVEYLYWDKIKYLKFRDIDSEAAWQIIKSKRAMAKKTLELRGHSTNINFYHTSNNSLNQPLHYLDFNFGAGIQKEQLLSDLDKQQYLKNALMEESIFSSMIEGATTTRIKAKEMLRKKKKPRNKSEQMILNNYEAIQYISKHQNETISLERLFEIHAIVTKNTLEKEHVGILRTSNDIHVKNEITGEIVHTPPKPEELKSLMSSFCIFFNENPKENFVHPIVKASILHFLIGYIHPFYDGNGRTARAIFYWHLLQNGYWLAEYLSISRVIMETKTQYEKAYLYTENDDMDVTYFIHYQVRVLTKAFEDLKKYMAKKRKQQQDLTKFLKISGINDRQAQILQWAEKDSTRNFTVKEIENVFSITNQTARTDLDELARKGYLKKIAINKKSSNYWKGEDFDTLLS